MGEEEGGGGTVDKIYLVPPNHYTSSSSSSSTSFSSFKERDDAQPVVPFNMKYLETHLPELYAMFPEEKQAIDRFLYLSNCAMHYVKVMVFARLLPSWMQSILWALTPRDITFTATVTSKELLDSLTSNLRLKALLSSMWIDTGARPDQASFMMGACVFRGISMEGGCYPVGGSTAMAKELVAVIHAYGGKVRIRAAVDSIVLDETCSKKPKVVGVRMADGSLIRSSRVVASNSVRTTFGKLLPPSICASHSTVLDFDVPQSDGFVMCNIGIAASAEEIGATNTNTWHIPVDERGDAFHPLERFFANPLDDHVETPTFITFPSLKVIFVNICFCCIIVYDVFSGVGSGVD